ncbi:hypothetical protein Tco_0955075 [Tanacetum coccineum]|uniref:Reverse transcriptase zinc-binding domain-containing protein n=1 Tax=Tanacetum coccineum TaxID=301880 RepID=A0ABQ5E672_9ASTR
MHGSDRRVESQWPGIGTLSDREDTWKCSMKHDGSFTVACIRRHIDEKILHSRDSETRWNNLVPIKKARGVLEAIFISAMWVMWQYRNNVIFGGVKMKKNVMFDRKLVSSYRLSGVLE